TVAPELTGAWSSLVSAFTNDFPSRVCYVPYRECPVDHPGCSAVRAGLDRTRTSTSSGFHRPVRGRGARLGGKVPRDAGAEAFARHDAAIVGASAPRWVSVR